jgi:hypothetical protein
MSHLLLPRLHFRGEFRTDVTTCNNDDIASAFPAQQFVDSAQVKVDTFGMDDAAFAKWLREMAPPFGIRAGWNLYGDCSCGFVDAKVHGAHPAGGSLILDPAVDPIVHAAVELRHAVMVDLDPEGTLGTQIFCDEFSLFKSNELSIVAQPARLHSRFIARRNLGTGGFTAFAACWFAAIRPDRMTISAGASATLDSFRTAHAAGAGLFLAFCIYLLAPRISQQQLALDFAVKRPTHNPALGKVIGTLGVWRPHEMTTVPVGRRLNPGITLQHDHVPYQFNAAVAAIDKGRRVISLDMVNTVPETDEALNKVNIGALTLTLISSGSTGPERHDIADIAYDRPAYERQAGLVDVPYAAALDPLIDAGRLALVQASTGAIVLDEIDATVETDDRCVYLQVNDTTTIALRLHVKGAAAPNPATVLVKQYVTSNRSFSPATSASAVVAAPDQIALPSGRAGAISVKAIRPGTCLLAFLPPGEGADSLQFFANLRVLPTDNYDGVPDKELTFQLIYQEVLRYYHLLYPAMSEVFDLSNELNVTVRAQFIRDRIAKAKWDRSSYMPISRDLSDGKRKLLERWCDKILGA